MRLTRSARAITALAVASALLLTGCSTVVDDAAETAGAASDAFPVTLEHIYGETTITEKPERVITIGWNAQDVSVALGVVPVAITDFTWGTVDKYLPWFVEEVDALDAELPEILTMSDAGEYDYEQILALEPDVILAPHSGVTEEEYKRLTEIAPTVAYDKVAWGADWQDVTRTVGAALGQSEKAEELLTETNAIIDAHAADHPEFADATVAYGWAWVEGDPALGFYMQSDAREILLEQLGFQPSAKVAELSKDATEFYEYVSLEELDTVDADLYVAWSNSQEEYDAMLKNPLVADWAPIADGNVYMMTTQELGWASSQPSVLSIPFSLDIIVPELAAVLAD